MSLPEGPNRDHIFCNPMIHHRRRGGGEDRVDIAAEMPGEGLRRGPPDRPVVMLEEQAARTMALLDREGFHAVELFDSSEADLLIVDIKQFLSDSSPRHSHRLWFSSSASFLSRFFHPEICLTRFYEHRFGAATASGLGGSLTLKVLLGIAMSPCWMSTANRQIARGGIWRCTVPQAI
ncbi:hypothetical protein Taro_016595 [Colocasia esculenta]|uniref:Uncharacterized protein n=1 Tax=Colocasia esculenta TaxID=4460 RepID=A0A843UQM0_COLES|nr:hypothetical protein [Colocasia esculenta]